MTPSWYDVLGVAPEASTDEIRRVWRTSVDGLDPTDRLFRQRNRAAEVLLDPDRRAAHDADLAADDAADDDAADDVDGDAPVALAATSATKTTTSGSTSTSTADLVDDDTDDAPDDDSVAAGSPGGGLRWFTGGVGVLALALVVATIVAALNVGGNDASAATSTTTAPSGAASASPAASGALPDQAQVDDAVGAARAAIGPVLSYDYRSLEASEKTAESYMTPAYSAEYQQYFSVVKANAPTTQTVVTADVLDAGVVRTDPGRVDVLLFVNRPTTNKQTSTTYHDQVTARMLDTGGVWLVDCLITQPNGTCGH